MESEESISLGNISHETMRKLSWDGDASIREIKKKDFKIEFENETEDSVDIVIKPRIGDQP